MSIDPGYQKFIVPPPPLASNQEKAEVRVGMVISQLMDIRSDTGSQSCSYILCVFSEVGGYFQVQFLLTMKWFETRLRFKNLKDDIKLNTFLPTERDVIWVPELIFSNTEEKPSTVVDEKTSILVDTTYYPYQTYQLSDKDENSNIQYFSGAENPLHLRRFYNQRFLCNYQLKWYPFDVQKCHLVLEIKESYSPYVKLLIESLGRHPWIT